MKFRVEEGKAQRERSRPARGAWIEIEAATDTCTVLPGRAPQGARGLKFRRPGCDEALLVAPRKGRVD